MNKEKLSKQIHDNELYYQSTDFIAEILSNKYRDGDIIIPEYQRQFEWNEIKQSQFIESLFLNLPAPSIFFIQNDKGIFEVSDGSQRLRTLHNFFQGNLTLNGLEILTELNGIHYDDLEVSQQRKIRNKPVKGYVFLNITEKMTEELFDRVNRQSSATANK